MFLEEDDNKLTIILLGVLIPLALIILIAVVVVYFKRRKPIRYKKNKKEYLDDSYIQMENKNYNSIKSDVLNDIDEDINTLS